MFAATPPILIAEDELFIALDLALAVQDAGGIPVGPAGSVREALALLTSGDVAAAILDINLGHDQAAYPVAEALAARGIPFLFMTGYGPENLDSRFRHYPVLQKPVVRDALAEEIEKLGRRPATTAA